MNLSNEQLGFLAIAIFCVICIVSALWRIFRKEKVRTLSAGYKPQADERTYKGWGEKEKR